MNSSTEGLEGVPRLPRDATDDVDVVVIGAGLAGSCAATNFARQGRCVVLADTHAVRAPEFRAEKLGEMHLALFQQVGMREAALRVMTEVDKIAVYRFGRFAGLDHQREYNFAYADLVNSLRAAVPKTVRSHLGRVAAVTTGPERQCVEFADGSVVRPRLVVVATGHGDAIRRKVGIRAVEVQHAHSLSLGFDLARPPGSFPSESLTFYGSGQHDRVAYLTLFPIGSTMRANLFVYRDVTDPWTRRFRQAPNETLRETLPELEANLGPLNITGPIDVRPIHLTRAEDHRRDGVVLIGDAFAISCPIPGNGIQRALTDVDRLCREYAPAWFATEGMSADKICQFYDDPQKQAMDEAAFRSSVYARRIAVDPGMVWRARRLRNTVVRRGMIWARQQSRVLAELGRRPNRFGDVAGRPAA